MIDEDILDPSEFLEHYGVKGMQWGVRRTKAERQAARADRRETAAQRHEAKAQKAQDKLDRAGRYASRDYKQGLMKKQARELKAAKDIREGRLTSTQKKMAAGAALAAAYGAYTVVQSGEAHRTSLKGKAWLKGESVSWKKNEALSGDLGVDDLMSSVVSQVNPDYGAIGSKMNCRRCTFAYEMRRRGYDVKATKTTNGRGQTLVGLANAIDPNASPQKATGKIGTISGVLRAKLKSERTGSANTISELVDNAGIGRTKIDPDRLGYTTGKGIFDALKRQPKGSRGEVAITGVLGNGHSVAYEIVRGKPVVFDAQTGKKFTSSKAFDSFFKEGTVKTAGLTRLDNVDLNPEQMLRWLKDA